MVAITATNSATPSLQAVLGRTRLEQARREASQAEATAQNLRAQADEAERDAAKSQNKVRELAARNLQPDPTYTAQVQASQPEKPPQSRDIFADLSRYTRQTRAENSATLANILNAIPVVNRPNPSTGRIINESA